MRSNKMYLTTGAFAKLCHVSKHTLFHYNDVGVFEPQYIGEKGYRYYHVLQYDTFSTINHLRAIGMSLNEIKRYLNQRSPDSLIALFNEQEKNIECQIKKLKKIQSDMIDTKEAIIEAMNSGDDCFIKNEKKAHFQVSKASEEVDDYDMTLSFAELIGDLGNEVFRPISGMIHLTRDLKEAHYNKKFWFYMGSICQEKDCSCMIKPNGNFLVAYHYGGFDILKNTYQKILLYAKKKNMNLGPYFYDEMVVGDWAVKNSNDYIIKVSVQVL